METSTLLIITIPEQKTRGRPRNEVLIICLKNARIQEKMNNMGMLLPLKNKRKNRRKFCFFFTNLNLRLFKIWSMVQMYVHVELAR